MGWLFTVEAALRTSIVPRGVRLQTRPIRSPIARFEAVGRGYRQYDDRATPGYQGRDAAHGRQLWQG